MKKFLGNYNLPPLGMTLPGAGAVLIIAAVAISHILLPYREAMDFSAAMAPWMVLTLAVFLVGFVFALAKK